jgi:hypothetical protein
MRSGERSRAKRSRYWLPMPSARDSNATAMTMGLARRVRSLTSPRPGSHHRRDMRRPWRSWLVLMLVPCFAFSSVIAPPEHVHEADADHPHAIDHRHFKAHHHEEGDHDHGFDRDDSHPGPEISHREGRVIWLDDASVQPGTHAFPVLDIILTACFEAISESARWVAASSYNAAPPHGPPRPCLSLRGPPLLPV